MLYDIFDPGDLFQLREKVLNAIIKDALKTFQNQSLPFPDGYHLDCQKVLANPLMMNYIGSLMVHSLLDTEAVAIGRLSTISEPIVFSTALMSGLYHEAYKKQGRQTPLLSAFSIRSENGVKLIEGAAMSGQKVCLVKDVCTNKDESIYTTQLVQAFRFEVTSVRILIDCRDKEEIEKMSNHFPDTKAIFTIKDILI